MSRAFQNDRQLKDAYLQAEHAVDYNGKVKVGKYFYHPLGKRFIEKSDAVRLRNMIDQVGYHTARIYMVSQFDPRYDIYVRRKQS